MYRKPLLTLLFLSIALYSLAQSNYRRGYVINTQNDTIKGYIDERDWNNNPKKIRFKTTLSGNSEEFSTSNIKCFGLPDENLSYERYLAKISTSSVSLSNIKAGVDTSSIVDTVFLQVVIKDDPISLYRYADKIKARYYYKEKNASEPVELKYFNFYSLDDETKVVTQKRFAIQLIELARRYAQYTDAFAQHINDANYEGKELTRIVNQINGSHNSKNQYAAKSKTRFYAGVGINSSSTKYSNSDNDAFSSYYTNATALAINAKNKTSFLPKINFGTDVYLSKSIENLYFRGDLSFTGAQSNIISSIPQPALEPVVTSASFKQYTVSLSPQIVYNIINAKNLQFSLSAGFALNLSTYSNQKFEQTGITSTPFIKDNYPELKAFWPQFTGRAAVTISKIIEIYGSYLSTSTITKNYESFSGRERNIQLGINYIW